MISGFKNFSASFLHRTTIFRPQKCCDFSRMWPGGDGQPCADSVRMFHTVPHLSLPSNLDPDATIISAGIFPGGSIRLLPGEGFTLLQSLQTLHGPILTLSAFVVHGDDKRGNVALCSAPYHLILPSGLSIPLFIPIENKRRHPIQHPSETLTRLWRCIKSSNRHRQPSQTLRMLGCGVGLSRKFLPQLYCAPELLKYSTSKPKYPVLVLQW